MKLFQHKALGGSIVITSCARYECTPGYRGPGKGYTVASFDSGGMGQKALAIFQQGLALGTVCTVGMDRADVPSLFDEETQQYVVGDAGQLAA
jgi:hypothetical protein